MENNFLNIVQSKKRFAQILFNETYSFLFLILDFIFPHMNFRWLRKTYILPIVLFSTVAFSQNASLAPETPKEYFPTTIDTLDVSKSGYYVAEIEDKRSNKTNNGYVEREKVKYRLVFQDSLPLYLSSFFRPKNATNLAPLLLQVEKFRIFSSSTSNSDEGQIYIKLHLIDLNTKEEARTIERTYNYRKKSQEGFIGKLVYEAIKTSFMGLKRKQSLSSPPIIQNRLDTTGNPREHYTKSVDAPTSTTHSSTGREIHTIPFSTNKVYFNSPKYYIARIKDIRSYQKNEGTVLKGFFNKKTEAKLDSNVEKYIQNLLPDNQDSSKKPLTLYIKNLTLSEVPSASGEQGTLFFAANLTYDSLDQSFLVYQSEVQLDSASEENITNAWPTILAKGLNNYFKEFEASPKALLPFNLLQTTSYYTANQITEEKYHFRGKYFWNYKEINNLKGFDPAFAVDIAPVKNTYSTAKSLIRTGNVSMAFGAVFLAYAGLDYLLVEDKSLRSWYKGSNSSSIMVTDKKLFVHLGATHLIGGLLCNIVGKSLLQKAIAMHNKSLSERISFFLLPDLPSKGCGFQFNMLLGCK